MVTHPSSLKGRILTIITKDQESLALCMLKHVLRENVHIRDLRRSHGTCRFTVPTA